MTKIVSMPPGADVTLTSMVRLFAYLSQSKVTLDIETDGIDRHHMTCDWRPSAIASPPPAVPAGEPVADDPEWLVKAAKKAGFPPFVTYSMLEEFAAEVAARARPSGAVPVELEQIIKFLLGEGELDGLQFGEYPSDKAGKFWWRKNLRAALEGFIAGVKA
jgi:hypothetical protein